jgi:hypothetical protein
MNSKMCDGCPKIYLDDKTGINKCWFNGSRIGFWNDLLTGFECDYYENYKRRLKEDK